MITKEDGPMLHSHSPTRTCHRGGCGAGDANRLAHMPLLLGAHTCGQACVGVAPTTAPAMQAHTPPSINQAAATPPPPPAP
jgi:hypothetical protein